MQAVDSFTAGKSLGLGLLLSTLNTKNLPIAVGVAAAVLQAELSGAGNVVVVGVYTAVVAIGVAAPLFIYFGMSDRAEAILGGMRTWLRRYNNVIMTVLFLIIGANLASAGWQGMF